METESNCIHDTPIDQRCEELCEHGKRCGAECLQCKAEYCDDIDRIAELVGRGDRKKGAEAIVRMIEAIQAKEGSDG